MAERGQKTILIAAGAFIALLLLVASVAFPAPEPADAAKPAEAGFSKLRKLVGEWQGPGPKSYGNAVIKLNYRLISDDSVLIETFRIPEQDLEMLTVYHLDGERLALTHYCAVNNQIRMLADLSSVPGTPAEIRRIDFAFRDGSNIEHAHQEVMDRLGIVFEDDKHLTQVWHCRDEKSPTGEDSAVYRYTRVK